MPTDLVEDTAPGSLEIRGGSAGRAADLADLDLAAAALLACARTATEVLALVSRLAIGPEAWLDAPLSPVTAGEVAAGLMVAAGPAGLAGDVAALTALAESVRVVAAWYRYDEAEATRTLNLVEN